MAEVTHGPPVPDRQLSRFAFVLAPTYRHALLVAGMLSIPRARWLWVNSPHDIAGKTPYGWRVVAVPAYKDRDDAEAITQTLTACGFDPQAWQWAE